MIRPAMLAALSLLAACNAPDYTPVRDWARTASLAADDPVLGATRPPTEPDGVLAMQEALATYLAALARMADDGVLPYMENPFVELATRAASADPAGGEAVSSIGTTLRRATRSNWRAPHLRDAIVIFDPSVQRLVSALAEGAVRLGPSAPPAADARPPAAGRAVSEHPSILQARADYADVVRRIGEGHALLKERAAHITRGAAVQAILAQQDQLRRAMQALPRPVVTVPAAPP